MLLTSLQNETLSHPRVSFKRKPNSRMITGLELAFAIVPLVVSATEHHQKAYRKYKTFTAPDEKLEDFLSDLHDEISLLGLTLRNLVSDLPTLTDKQKDAILNLDRGIWGQEDVTNAIQARLGGNADQAFSDILTRLLKCLDEVVSEKAFIFVSSGDVSITSSYVISI